MPFDEINQFKGLVIGEPSMAEQSHRLHLSPILFLLCRLFARPVSTILFLKGLAPVRTQMVAPFPFLITASMGRVSCVDGF